MGETTTSCTLDSRAMSWRDHTSTPSVTAKAATSAATPMTTPVVESSVRSGLARSASAPTRADSIREARFNGSWAAGNVDGATLGARPLPNTRESPGRLLRRPRRPEDAAREVVEEGRLGVALLGVAERRVPGASAVAFVVPGDGVARTHLAPGVGGLVERRQHV